MADKPLEPSNDLIRQGWLFKVGTLLATVTAVARAWLKKSDSARRVLGRLHDVLCLCVSSHARASACLNMHLCRRSTQNLEETVRSALACFCRALTCFVLLLLRHVYYFGYFDFGLLACFCFDVYYRRAGMARVTLCLAHFRPQPCFTNRWFVVTNSELSLSFSYYKAPPSKGKASKAIGR